MASEGEDNNVVDEQDQGMKRPGVADEATAASSECDEMDSFDENSMPLFKYSRMNGSVSRLPRRVPSTAPCMPLSSKCSCSQLGRVLLPRREDGTVEVSSDLGHQPVLLTGHSDGMVSFILVESGAAILDSKQLQVNPTGEQVAIVDVSLDASANYLAAINVSGCCAIWEVRYGTPSEVSTQEPEQDNVFKSFLTNLAGQSSSSNASTDSSNALKTSSAQVSRIVYSSSFGAPTCLVLDPCYKKRREKSLLVAFSDGRLVLTKRGFVFQRRNDAVIYQATAGDCIEAMTWRGTLVSWADASGIKIFDVDSMTRIAHIDRPVGARASLYPTISDLKPCLCFETSNNLLVAWGDCVMTMTIKETIVRQSAVPDVSGSSIMASGSMHAAEVSAGSTIVKRRQVECSMAWELDCVACGVAPLDKDHLIVLGLVPNDDEDRDGTDGPNDVEVQVISRSEGTVTYADALPIMRFPSQFVSTQGGPIQESASAYNMVSSFSIPRLEDTAEAEEEGTTPDKDFDFTLFASNTDKSTFLDSHLRWNLASIEFDGKNSGEDKSADEMKSDDDSDDYGFVLRQSSNLGTEAMIRGSAAPVLVVSSPADLVTIRASDVDDAVSHALARHKVGLALNRALRHKRMVRRHDMDSLVDSFLRTVLCIDDDGSHRNEQKLSIRRLELAAKSTPVLLGGSLQRWELWVNEFARIPGALFVLCDQLPVRDPKLPLELYEGVLCSLFGEIETMLKSADGDETVTSPGVMDEAVNRFLGALCAWGPTHALREKIQFHEQFVEEQRRKFRTNDVVSDAPYESLDFALQRRLTQSAACYLEIPTALPAQPKTPISLVVTNNSGPTIVDSPSDSLFQIKEMIVMVSSRVPILKSDSRTDQNVVSSSTSPYPLNTKVSLLAMAELNVMMMKYDAALHCYLVIGSLFSPEPLAVVEARAVKIVNHGEGKGDPKTYRQYGFVLAMVERHYLHGSLLDTKMLGNENDDKLSPPLISLVRLLGLEVVGNFLVECSVPPPARLRFDSAASGASSVNSADSELSKTHRDGDETLPINYVAEQLRTSPSLLHWYLNLMFTRRPEIYVDFPTNSVPPRAVTELHRAHLELYVDFSEDRDSALSLVGTEVYNQERKTTPLLLFLKAALPLGGIRPDEVRRLFETKRTDGMEDVAEFPTSFALELAYVIEHYGGGSEEDSQQVLDLYLKGAKSVMLAAAYAQRNKSHATILWETLIEHCTAGGGPGESIDGEDGKVDGTMFGSLLEAAALCGADVALLVSSIPEGMNIEGLRPRLVAAVADYRMKLTMHEAAADVCRKDRIGLLRELGHRSRRGLRQRCITNRLEHATPETPLVSPSGEHPNHGLRRPVERPSRYRLSARLPMR